MTKVAPASAAGRCLPDSPPLPPALSFQSAVPAPNFAMPVTVPVTNQSTLQFSNPGSSLVTQSLVTSSLTDPRLLSPQQPALQRNTVSPGLPQRPASAGEWHPHDKGHPKIPLLGVLGTVSPLLARVCFSRAGCFGARWSRVTLCQCWLGGGNRCPLCWWCWGTPGDTGPLRKKGFSGCSWSLSCHQL